MARTCTDGYQRAPGLHLTDITTRSGMSVRLSCAPTDLAPTGLGADDGATASEARGQRLEADPDHPGGGRSVDIHKQIPLATDDTTQ